MKKKNKNILLCLFLFLMILSFCSLLSWNKENKNIKKILNNEKKYLISIQNTDNKPYLNKKLFKDNPDTIGWLKVEGTNINYPIVQYNDNEYYLKHDFKKNKNSAGWIFMDYKNDFNDQNIVIYGHNRRDKSMFGTINMLFDSKFYKNNKDEILLIKENEIIKYKIFSVYKIHYTDDYNSLNYESLKEKITIFKKRSELPFDLNFENAKQIITLSTCSNDNRYRLVVHGLKV